MADAARRFAWAGWAMLAAALFAYHWRLSAAFAKTSDQANFLLAGRAMLAGNWRLHGWWLVPDNFSTTEIPLGALLSAVASASGAGPVAPWILVVQPAISWTCLTMLSLALAGRGAVGRPARLAGGMTALAVVGVPLMRERVGYFITLSGIHVWSILLALLCLVLAAAWLRDRRWRWLIAHGAVLGAGCFGDPLVAVIGALPVLVALPFARGAPSARGWLALMTVASIVAARAALALDAHTGGFVSLPLVGGLAPAGVLWPNVKVAGHGMLELFGADLVSTPWRRACPELLRLPLVLLAGLAVLRALGAARRGGGADFFTLALALGVAADVAALVFGTRIEIEAGSIATARYLYPAWIFSGILLARAAWSWRMVPVVAGLGLVAALISNLAVLRRPAHGVLEPQQAALAAAMVANGPRLGLAPYWDASILQVATAGGLAMYQATADGAGHLVPFRNISPDVDFAALTRAPFFVVITPEHFQYGPDDVRRSFGAPGGTRQIGPYTVWIYAAIPSLR